MRIAPQPAFRRLRLRFELRQGCIVQGVSPVRSSQSSDHQLMVEAASIGQYHFAHQSAVTVDVMHLHGDGLPKRQFASELACSGPEGLLALGRVDAMQPDLDGLVAMQHIERITIDNAHDFAAELFLTDRRRQGSHARRHQRVGGPALVVQAIAIVRTLVAVSRIAACVGASVGRAGMPTMLGVAVGADERYGKAEPHQ